VFQVRTIENMKFHGPHARSLSPIVIRLGALGDMINLSSLVHFLHQRYGNPCVLIGAGSWSEPIYRGNPDVAQVWVLDRHVPFLLNRAGWGVLAALRRSAPAPVYVCDDDKQLLRVQRLLKLSGVDPRRTLFINGHPRESEQHHLDRLINFGKCTPPALPDGSYPLPPSAHVRLRAAFELEPERAELRQWLLSRGWAGKELILVQPGNRRTISTRRGRHRRLGRDDKYWPSQRWIELFRRIHARKPNALILLCGAPQEEGMLRQLCRAAQMPGVVDVASLPIRLFFALCEAAHSMVSVDTGPAHAAAASGLRLVVMFGAQRQSRWLPRSPSGTRVIGLGGPPLSSHIEQISVEEVFEAWDSLAEQQADECELEAQPRLAALTR
jgi:ADP-heptose:LPS heptosyltransferase